MGKTTMTELHSVIGGYLWNSGVQQLPDRIPLSVDTFLVTIMEARPVRLEVVLDLVTTSKQVICSVKKNIFIIIKFYYHQGIKKYFFS